MPEQLQAEPAKEWVILATRHEGGINKNLGGPLYAPNMSGYVHRMTGAGLYTEQVAKSEAARASGLTAYHFADPLLREYLQAWCPVRASEWDLFHQVRALLAATPAPAAPLADEEEVDAPAGTSFCMGIDVAGLLINGKKHYKGLVSDDNDEPLTPRQTRAWLVDQLLKGRTVLPMGECDNWDEKAGRCKGHVRTTNAGKEPGQC